ncbi:MAG TPA: abortive infection family protein [Hyphomonadaceae bacterium]|nr:abortive infection family protein [Hyphomonadaceae bacterium]HPN05983.1 abortive infection family protein [Hyphomonadaceae bacterium]
MTEQNEITEVTRRDIFDVLRLGSHSWNGRQSESAFLGRIWNLESMRSNDYRCKDMLQDVLLHRERFGDGDDDWIFDDSRLNLLRGPDEIFLQFLCETVHPIIRPDPDEATALVERYNSHLKADGFQLAVRTSISGKAVYATTRSVHGISNVTLNAREIASTLSSDHLMTQITRMEASVYSDPQLAIGTAKEFVESICKGILRERGVSLSGNEDLPKLAKIVRDELGLASTINSADEAVRKGLASIATLVQSIAELRGQLGTGHGGDPAANRPPTETAGLSVRMATALGVFLFERHRATPSGTPP